MKNKILSILFCSYIIIIFIINLIIKNKDISYSERRYLNKLPNISITNLLNGTITDNFENYVSDHFILRDKFRSFKAFTEFNIFSKLDYNNLYVKDNYIYKIEYPLKENKVISFTDKMNKLYDTYFKNLNVYYSIIPDKSYYSSDNYLKIDYDKLINIVNSNINKNMKYIDITKCLDINDYYYTDIHWKQENLNNVVNTLSKKMDFKVGNNYIKHTYEPFYGSYYGQIGLNVKNDKLTYLTNDTINNAKVTDIENKINSVYKIDSLGKIDSYDVFLGGATPIVEINSINNNSKELIIFRDSFGSSIAPLLIDGYHKITLVDLRYISSDLIKNYIEFKDQDILLLYNTTIINNSDMLKK